MAGADAAAETERWASQSLGGMEEGVVRTEEESDDALSWCRLLPCSGCLETDLDLWRTPRNLWRGKDLLQLL